MLINNVYRFANTYKRIYNPSVQPANQYIEPSGPGIINIPNHNQSGRRGEFYAYTIPDPFIPNNTRPVYFGDYFLRGDESDSLQITTVSIYWYTSTGSGNVKKTPPVLVRIQGDTVTIEDFTIATTPQTLASYFGLNLQNFITTNAAAVGSDFGISATEAQDPDKLLAAIFRRSHQWQEADGLDQNGVTIGYPEKVQGIARREGQIGYRYPATFWQPDSRAAALPIAQIY